MSARVARLGAHANGLVGRDHFVNKRPVEAATQLCDDGVAVAEEVNVEVDVVDGLAGDVDLGHVRG